MTKRKSIPGFYWREDKGLYEHRFTVDGKRYSVYGKTIKECQENELKRRKEIEEKAYTRNRNLTLDTYFKEWVTHKEQSISASTLGNYERTYRLHIAPVLGKRKIREIERREIMQFQSRLHKQLSTGVTRLAMGVLKQVFKSAVMDEVLVRNICASLPTMKPKENERPARETIHRALTEEELRIFFKYAAESWYLNLFSFLLYTGLRAGEACALEWRDIDWKSGVIHIRRTITASRTGKREIGQKTKTRSSKRDIPINEVMADILHRQWEIYSERYCGSSVRDMCGPVFMGIKGQHIFPSALDSAIQQILKRAEKHGETMERFSAHAFRDTFASRAAAQGIDMNVLKELMGHASLSMTSDLYCHVYKEQKQSAMREMKAISL